MDGLIPSVLWYAVPILILVSLVAMYRSKRARRRAIAVIAGSIIAASLLAIVPAPVTTVAAPLSHLDEVAPTYHYAEKHERHVNAAPERVYAAMKATTADDIRLFQTLTWIRRGGQAAPISVLNAPDGMPILEVATRSGFVLLADDPPRELVVGTVVVAPSSARGKGPLTADLYPKIQAPGFVKAAMNFRIVPEGPGSRITTETRVTGTDSSVIRRFTPYWRTILPGSWILRVTWLDAIARRAETN